MSIESEGEDMESEDEDSMFSISFKNLLTLFFKIRIILPYSILA